MFPSLSAAERLHQGGKSDINVLTFSFCGTVPNTHVAIDRSDAKARCCRNIWAICSTSAYIMPARSAMQITYSSNDYVENDCINVLLILHKTGKYMQLTCTQTLQWLKLVCQAAQVYDIAMYYLWIAQLMFVVYCACFLCSFVWLCIIVVKFWGTVLRYYSIF